MFKHKSTALPLCSLSHMDLISKLWAPSIIPGSRNRPISTVWTQIWLQPGFPEHHHSFIASLLMCIHGARWANMEGKQAAAAQNHIFQFTAALHMYSSLRRKRCQTGTIMDQRDKSCKHLQVCTEESRIHACSAGIKEEEYKNILRGFIHLIWRGVQYYLIWKDFIVIVHLV